VTFGYRWLNGAVERVVNFAECYPFVCSEQATLVLGSECFTL